MTRGCSTSAGCSRSRTRSCSGMPDFGKSSLTKSWLYRSRVFGRRCEIIDPKGEYGELVHALGGVVLRLEPGGETRLNPLTRIGTPEMREGLLLAVAHAMLNRPLGQAEAVGVVEALAAADEQHAGRGVRRARRRAAARPRGACHPGARPDPRGRARAPARSRARVDASLPRAAARHVRRADQRGENVWDAPALSLDISRVAAGSATSDLALAITMVCATAFLDAKRMRRTLEAQAAGGEAREDDPGQRRGVARAADRGPRRVLPGRVQAGSPDRRAALDGAAPPHGPRRRRRPGHAASRRSRRVCSPRRGPWSSTASTPRRPTRAKAALGLSTTEAQRISHYPQGVALWRIGGRSYEVRHIRSQRERALTATDAAMAPREPPGAHPEHTPLGAPA